MSADQESRISVEIKNRLTHTSNKKRWHCVGKLRFQKLGQIQILTNLSAQRATKNKRRLVENIDPIKTPPAQDCDLRD